MRKDLVCLMVSRLLILLAIGFNPAVEGVAQGLSKDGESHVILDWPTARVTNAEIHLLNSEAEYSRLWRQTQAGESDWLRPTDKPKAARAPMDFSRNKILAIFWGRHPSASYSISFKTVMAKPAVCHVEAVTRVPSGLDFSALSFPAAAVALPKTCKVHLAISGRGSGSFKGVKNPGLKLSLR